MLPIPLVLFLIATLHAGNVNAQPSSLKKWGRPLRFEDFLGRPNATDTAAANISVSIVLGYGSDANGNLRFTVYAAMDKNESWIKDRFRLYHILRHEEGHLDIAQIHAAKLAAVLAGKRFTEVDIETLNALYASHVEEMNIQQLAYDRETNGGWNEQAQSRWRVQIQSELADSHGLE